MTLAETITTGLNNPECAFFVGQTIGNSSAIYMIFVIAVIGFLYKAVNKLAFEPFIDWIKVKLKRK